MTKSNIIVTPRHEGRRGFLRASSLGLAAIALGCGSNQSNPATPPTSDSGGGDKDTGGGGADSSAADSAREDSTTTADAKLEDVDATPECRDTDDNIEGPFFKPSSPERSDLVEAGMTGVKITISGRVLGTGCGIVLAGAIVDFWQADADGAYFDVKLRGHQSSMADGRFSLHTVIPGHYLNGSQYRPAHVHVKVQAPGYQLLTTQLYFEGDPYNAIDPFIKKSLIMHVADGLSGEKTAHFDFVLKAL